MTNDINMAQGFLLGAVQGITEFLPVSSSGHLILFRDLLGIPTVPLLFDVLLHLATLVVICFYYRSLILRLFNTAFRFIVGKRRDDDNGDLKLMGTVIGATVLTVVMALALRAVGAEDFSAHTVSAMMLVTAVLLATASIPKGTKAYKDFTWKTAVITGVAQGFGTLAGISRSGITITASLWSNMDRETAGEYAFILSIPAVVGALVLTLHDGGSGGGGVALIPVLAGCVSAFITGLFSLRLLLWMVKKARLWYFSIYLAVVGILGLTVLF